MNTQAITTLQALRANAATNVNVSITECHHPEKGICYSYTFTGIDGLRQPFTSGLYNAPTVELIQNDIKRECFISGTVLKNL